MNLPNALTVGRIAVTPLIAALPFASSWQLRLIAFVLFTLAALTDYVDGMLARSRKEETDLGRLLDPAADKLLLFGTLVPMYFLTPMMPFQTPVGDVPLPWWVVLIVLGREVAMTVFRQAAARRGVVIAAIGAAKWKTGFQLLWQGSAYCWFFADTLAERRGWFTSDSAQPWMNAFTMLNGIVGTLAMWSAVALTLYSLYLYLRRYGTLLRQPAPLR